MDSIVIVLSVVTVVLALTIINKDITIQKITKQHQEERKDLLNRIMAKDLHEYKDVNSNSKPRGSNPIKNKLSEFEGLYEE